MAGAPQGNNSEMITGINVTPLVDITLVLLIVFMVTASYIVKASIEVELPRAANGGEAVGEMLAVIVRQPEGTADKRGAPCTMLAVNGAVTDEAGLKAALRAALAKDKDAKVMISADTDCSHGEFVHVVDLVKEEGITKFAINIEKVAHAAPTPPQNTP
ncbi:MAG TPA: biopolymer transporter ExbD [Myxococcota bacterium]|nr:biopolymer transporter ExbD [Myxococcota bacterium]